MGINDWANAIASIESAGSGGYSALGPITQRGNRAYGKYQVMDFNIGPWTEKYLGKRLTPQEFLASPEAQDAVFRGEFGSYVQKYGNPQDAASAWFTGQPRSSGANRKDILGTTGSGYVEKFNRALGQGVAADTMAALGKGGGAVTPDQIAQSAQAQSTGMQEEQQPRGLLGNLFGNPDLMANLAIAFNSMRLNPDPNLPQVLSAQMKERRGQRQATAQKNRTLDYLRSLGTPQAMEAIRYAEGTGDIAGALKMATAAGKAEGTAAMQNYAEYNRILKDLGPEAASKFLEMTGGQKTVVSIQDKGETKMAETFGKGIAEQALQALEVGGQAQRNLGRYQLLGEILANAPQGGKGAFVAAASNLGIKLEGASDAEAAQAIINQLVPEQRQPGSGPMSDADLALFKQSLPRLVNTPEGNRLILETLNAISQYDIQRAMIAQELASGSIDTPEYLKKLNSLPNPLEMFRQAGGAAAPTMSREDALKILMSE